MITIPVVKYLMRTWKSTLELRPHYVWTRCSATLPHGLKSQRIASLRPNLWDDLVSLTPKYKTGRNPTLKYFVKIYCKPLKSAFLSLQYLTNMSHTAVSRTRATRQTLSSHSKIRSQKLQPAFVHRALERTLQLISGVLASARRVPRELASTAAGTTSHWTAQ